jgi:hypothetical protein
MKDGRLFAGAGRGRLVNGVKWRGNHIGNRGIVECTPLVGMTRTLRCTGRRKRVLARATHPRAGALSSGRRRIERRLTGGRLTGRDVQFIETVPIPQRIRARTDEVVAAGASGSRRGEQFEDKEHHDPCAQLRHPPQTSGSHCALAAERVSLKVLRIRLGNRRIYEVNLLRREHIADHCNVNIQIDQSRLQAACQKTKTSSIARLLMGSWRAKFQSIGR